MAATALSVALILVTSLPFCVPDSRHISYEDLMSTADSFSDPGVTSYSQLLFDVAREQVIVGARDTLYRLALGGLQRLEKAMWLAPPEKVQLCQDKGQTEHDCHNFIKVLLSNGKKLFTCGTNAFSPQCSWREMEDINRVTEWVRGVAKCPHSPHSNITALMTLNGQYFAGSPMDFSGTDAAITRDLGAPYLRTNQYNSKWLNEPQFVGSFETDAFVYFLFRESAVEYINCGKIIYSRIARVCKNDQGGQLMLRDNWTTFVKARLNCSLPGEYPFYFDEIQGMTYLPDEGLVYATFTTPRNSIPGSAICSFNLTAIQTAFNGPFKHQATVGSAWERHMSPHSRHSQCHETAPHQLLESSRYQLMDSAVQPTTQTPLYVSQLETITHIAVDVLPTKLHRAVHVMYVATVEGIVKKISVLSRTQKTCVLEVWKPIPNDVNIPILTLQYLKETDSVYLGTEEQLLRIPAQHCDRHKTKQACINSMDPYCGWNEHKERCMPPPNNDPLSSVWHQDATQCPILTHPVNGGWSAWSPWSPCIHSSSTDSTDECQCSSRKCDNPPPMHGGAQCQGMSIRVTNCTVHGSWSSWSAWSACSQTCGMAVKTRRRTCGNPAPAFGGRVCVGQDRHEMYCHSNPPCPAVAVPVRDGGWSSWSSWGECSAKCGGGFRVRTRRCDNPPPQSPGGLDCQGCAVDYEMCNTAPCVDSKRLSSWTPWIPSGNGTEKRFRFACRAPSPDPNLIKITQAKEEERVCQADGVCMRTDRVDTEDVWSDWSSWSPCSVECGGGQQYRVRTCEGRPEDCQGPPKVARACNTHNCKGEWSCWTDWSVCSVSCGIGYKQRTRDCLAVNNKDAEGSGCEGPSIAQEPCEMPTCQSLLGWETWSEWSPCDSSGQQHRTRECLASNPGPELCQGSHRESRICLENTKDINSINTQMSTTPSEAGVSMAAVIVFCILAFGFGLVVAVLLGYYWLKRRRHSVPGSPHYISSKQNPYVTVPLKEMHSPKRTPSFSAKQPSLSNGTPKLFAKQQLDFETATIKRNSHSMANGHIRADLEQDKFF